MLQSIRGMNLRKSVWVILVGFTLFVFIEILYESLKLKSQFYIIQNVHQSVFDKALSEVDLHRRLSTNEAQEAASHSDESGRNKSHEEAKQTSGYDDAKDTSSPPLTERCDYAHCNVGRPEMFNVHLVPHSHNDVGWLKTLDEYFYEGKEKANGVQYILDSVIQELSEDANKRFIYAEVAFFHRWWNQLDGFGRAKVKRLVSQSRLEFVLGGWSMNDEATTHYSSIIDQQTHGLRFLNETFGACGRPRVHWQIDAFGHSRQQASLSALFGFDGMFFTRIDYRDYDQRRKTKTLEHVWMGSDSLGDAATIFAGHLYQSYRYPLFFCFECGAPPVQDDPGQNGYNVKKRVDDFMNLVDFLRQIFSTNHVMLPMGADFHYANARVNFKNIDKLIRHVNDRQANGSRVNVFYSTPSCYLCALNQRNATYTRKDDDYFPYASRSQALWTGFYTSRPALKRYERTSNNFLQICKQLESLAFFNNESIFQADLDKLREAMGVLQHHDAVTGTCKQRVADDYANMLSKGVAACEKVVKAAFGRLLQKTPSAQPIRVEFCHLTNVTYCPISERNKRFVVVLYNPIARNVVDFKVTIPVTERAYTVNDADMKSISAQVIPLQDSMYFMPERQGSNAIGELVFQASVPGLGFSSYFIQASPVATESFSNVTDHSTEDDFAISNEFIRLDFSGKTGLMRSLTNTEKNLSIELSNTLMYYASHNGKTHNETGETASGMYVFRPRESSARKFGEKAYVSIVRGSEVQEVRQMLGEWGSQVVRLYRGVRYVEIEWMVGPIPVGDLIGKEVISRFTSNLNNNQTFYTDANGREIMKRVRNYRRTWKFNLTEDVAGNYYPVPSRIFIRDIARNLQLTVLTDRSQGGSSVSDGQIELMIHRRTLRDDGLGVLEPLDEPGFDGRGLVVKGKHLVFLDSIASSARLHREMAQRLYMGPCVGFVETDVAPSVYSDTIKTSWLGLTNALPPNVHLLTFECWNSEKFLLRLEHFYEANEDATLSQIVEVNLKNLFTQFTIESVEEFTLGANQPLAQAKRLQWNVVNYGRTQSDMSWFVKSVDPHQLVVELKPMQIRTFLVTIRAP